MSWSKPSQASKSAGKVHLKLEQLEDRLVPAVTFATYDHGTFAYNSNLNQWTRVSAFKAQALDEGADGVMFASIDTGGAGGTYRYNYWNNTWLKLTDAKTSVLSAASDNTLFATYGNGTYERDSQGWHRMSTNLARNLAAVRNNLCYATFASGTEQLSYASSTARWSRALLTTTIAGAMDSTLKGTLFASFTTGNNPGTFKYNASNGVWVKLTSNAALDIAAVDHEGLYTPDSAQFYATYASGTWNYNGRWNQMDTVAATNIAADGDTFVGSFDGNSVWEWDRWARAWSQIDDSSAAILG